ncbi:MAG: 3-isopropylmalate dehydratase small subunit, partial [Pseudomonadota bacterium]
FYNNALQNGLLAVVLPASEVTALAARLDEEPGLELSVDLEAQSLAGAGPPRRFAIDAYRKEALRLGLSETEMTLRRLEEIETFEHRHAAAAPWLAAPARS